MLAYFFGANLTQKGLQILSEFMESVMPNEDIKLPKTFDQIANLLLKKMDSKIKFEKVYYCSNCKLSCSKLNNSKQRYCQNKNCTFRYEN